jgi:hypothetical protein
MADEQTQLERIVIIRRRVPSQNASMYKHWSAYTKERDQWFILLRQQLPPRSPPDHPVRMQIRSYRTRMVDFANFVGGAKPIPDCLIRLGYLKDDNPHWFACEYQQFIVPKTDERTELVFLA